MKIESELVICKTINPNGKVLLVEITNLMLLPTIFYDEVSTLGIRTNEVFVVNGWLTVVACKLYRVTEIPEYDITFPDPSKKRPLYEVVVDWDDLDVKPEELPREGVEL